ncbi:hypothetical protein CRG98_009297 [Punica granatum]|uniref:Uncharacterized protein n=1 Tax=Punica granatum TaxID=22663 RepID=A0A2I0KP87_PUNGR|nr:hypothetical protein CRG98_009297 [Punica granatum]
MDRLIAPLMQRKRKSPNFSKSGMIIPSPGVLKKSRKVGKMGLGSQFYPLERTDPSRSSRVDWQTRLAVRLVGAMSVDLDLVGSKQTRLAPDEEKALQKALGGLLMQGRWLPTPKRPSEVAVVVVLQEVTQVDPICKKSEECQKTNRPDWAELTRLGRSEKMALPEAPDDILQQAVRTRISSRRDTHARAYATRLEIVHLPRDSRWTRVRRSRHLLFTICRSRAVESPRSKGTRNKDACHRIYNTEIETPKVDGMGRTNETRARTGRPFSSIDRGASNSLMPRDIGESRNDDYALEW